MIGLDPSELAFFLEEAPVVFFTTSGPTFPWEVTYVSPSVKALTGLSQTECLGALFAKALHPDDRAQAEKDAETLRAKGRVSFVYRMGFPSHPRGLLIEGVLRVMPNGDAAGYWAPQTDRERSRAILAAIPDAIFEVDATGRFTFVHATEQQAYISAILGSTVHDIFPKASADILLNAAKRAVSLDAPQVVKYALPIPQSGDCKHYMAHFGVSKHRDSVVAVVRDITSEVKGEAEIATQKKFLEEANHSLEQFVYVASHDLREPLIGMSGFATFLQRDYAHVLDETGRRFTENIVNGTKALEAKIDDLLALSRIARGTMTDVTPLNEIVASARRALIGQLVNVHIDIPEDLPSVRGDKGQIAQVFQNLLSNSIKYRKPTVAPRITIRVEEDVKPGMLLVSVADNGLGFDQKYAERIFGVFQRLYTTKEFPGTGIGLAIVKKVVERHGGRAYAVAQTGKGSTFYFSLPKG